MNPFPARLRFGSLLLVVVSSFGCGKSSPTAPTPLPVDPPTIACPMSQTLTSATASPIPVIFGDATVAGGKTPVSTVCTPASGSSFPLGSTTVTCTATDAQQRSSSCTLSIVVKAPPTVQLTRYFAFGDSITAGEDGLSALTSDIGGVLTFDRSVVLNGLDYPSVLRSALKARYTLQSDVIAVSNQGRPGEAARSADALSRFTQLVRGGGFQVALIMEGANDVYESYYSGTSAQSGAITGLQAMIRQARSSGVRVYLATIPPQNRAACTPICRGLAADLVPGFNDRVRSLAGSEGVPLIDVYKAFNGDLTLLSPDGLHPNVAGYDRIADTFFQGIKATIEIPPAVSGITGLRSAAAFVPVN